jgi:hypothetical protein
MMMDRTKYVVEIYFSDTDENVRGSLNNHFYNLEDAVKDQNYWNNLDGNVNAYIIKVTETTLLEGKDY